MKYSLKEISRSLPPEKARIEPFWAVIFTRPVSYLITYPLVNIGVTANAVSVFSCVWTVFTTVVMCLDTPYSPYLGVVMLNIWGILDCVDGNIARCTKKSSMAGEFFDAMGGYTISGFWLLSIGMCGYNTSIVLRDFRMVVLLLGATAGIANVMGRLVYQKYSNNIMIMEVKRVGKSAAHTENEAFYSGKGKISKFKKIISTIDYNMGVGGNAFLFIIPAVIFNFLDIFAIVYSLYYMAGSIVVFFLYGKKMAAYGRENSPWENYHIDE